MISVAANAEQAVPEGGEKIGNLTPRMKVSCNPPRIWWPTLAFWRACVRGSSWEKIALSWPQLLSALRNSVLWGPPFGLFLAFRVHEVAIPF